MDIFRSEKNCKFFIIFIVIACVVCIYTYIEKDVSIIVDGSKKSVKTYSNNVEDILKENNINLEHNDYVNVDLEDKVFENMQIVIKKAVKVSVKVDGRTIKKEVVGSNVEEVLEFLNVSIDKNDKIYPQLNNEVNNNINIEVIRVDEEIVIENEEVPFKEVINYDDDMDRGKIKTIQNGEVGSKQIKKKEIYENGKLVDTEILEEKIVKQPTIKIVRKGTKDLFVSSRGNTSYKKSLVMVASAYDLSYQSTGKRPGDKNYGITASGTKARPGVVAVDPKVIPLGSKLYIEAVDGTKDYGFAVAEDTGGAIKGNRIDLFFENHKDALDYGKRKVKVYILE